MKRSCGLALAFLYSSIITLLSLQFLPYSSRTTDYHNWYICKRFFLLLFHLSYIFVSPFPYIQTNIYIHYHYRVYRTSQKLLPF